LEKLPNFKGNDSPKTTSQYFKTFQRCSTAGTSRFISQETGPM
jgi:hypothetical protein